MRVIAGTFRSRPLLAPAGTDTRPTADRLRQSLFNVLTQGAVNRVAGASFLDLFAGSGAVGIEAISRGATQAVFVEQAAPALVVLRKNLENLGLAGKQANRFDSRIRIESRGVSRVLPALLVENPSPKFGVIFLDPPYDLTSAYESTLELLGDSCFGLLDAAALVVAEHRRKTTLALRYGNLQQNRVIEQGDAALSFYAPQAAN